MHKNKTKEPLFHIAKRAALPWYLSWAIRIGAIVLALVACAALTVFLTHENPFQVYATMFDGAFGSPRRRIVSRRRNSREHSAEADT